MLIQKDLVVILETSSVGQNRHFAFSVYPLACRGMPITICLDVCVSYTFVQKIVRKHVLLAKIPLYRLEYVKHALDYLQDLSLYFDHLLNNHYSQIICYTSDLSCTGSSNNPYTVV